MVHPSQGLASDLETPPVEAGQDITKLLNLWRSGSLDARDALFSLVVGRLRRIAASQLRSERVDHTLAPTALVNEAYLRLSRQRSVRWTNRAHFYTVAAMIMRRVLVDHARKRACRKRGDGWRRVPMEAAAALEAYEPEILVDVDRALERLAENDPVLARLVELRYFVGLSIAEAGEVLGLSRSSAFRRWRLAKAWLLTALADEPPGTE